MKLLDGIFKLGSPLVGRITYRNQATLLFTDSIWRSVSPSSVFRSVKDDRGSLRSLRHPPPEFRRWPKIFSVSYWQGKSSIEISLKSVKIIFPYLGSSYLTIYVHVIASTFKVTRKLVPRANHRKLILCSLLRAAMHFVNLITYKVR